MIVAQSNWPPQSTPTVDFMQKLLYYLGTYVKYCKSRNIDFNILLILDNAPSNLDVFDINSNVQDLLFNFRFIPLGIIG